MLARQLFRAVNAKKNAPVLSALVRSAFSEGPERDLVNFPRPVRPETSGPVRFLFIPEEWFELFYKKTGVTGPYAFGTGVLTYLLSKEIWVIEHEFPYVCCLAVCFGLGNYYYGPTIGKALAEEVAKEEEKSIGFRRDSINQSKEAIEKLKKEIWRTEAQKELFVAKKDNIHMQLEAEYRVRALDVYNQVKKRLDYQVQIENIDRRIAHKNMVQWIIDSVKKSITPQQEKESLKKCFADLQALAAKA